MIKNITADMIGLYVDILSNDEELRSTLFEYNLYDETESKSIFIFKTVKVLLEDSNFKYYFDRGNTSKEIYEQEYKKFRDNFAYHSSSPFYRIQLDIYENYGILCDWYNDKFRRLYEQIVFTFLYGNIKNFFYQNRKRFLPEYDWFIIENNNKKRIHIESFFREFDKFSTIIAYMSNLKDVDEIPDDYIAYLSSILGIKFDLEQDDIGYTNVPEGFFRRELLSSSKIRSVLKNIAEVYRSKGSKFAYELFFNSIGLEVVLKETYFDRRLFWYYSGINENIINTETDEVRTNKFAYYLTSKNPSITFYAVKPDEKVSVNNMTVPKTESAFDYMISKVGSSIESLKKILGYTEDSSIEDTFTYFKTNILLLDFKYYMADTDEESIISQKHRDILKSYIDMITPIYIKKYYPEMQSAETTFLERFNVVFFSPDGTRVVENLDGSYTNFERSNVNSINYYINDSDRENIGNDYTGKLKDVDELTTPFEEGENNGDKANTDVAFANHQSLESFSTGFNFTNYDIGYPLEQEFREESPNILDNIVFEWEPTISATSLTELDGYIVIDYYDDSNPLVAVSIQNGTENSINLTISDV